MTGSLLSESEAHPEAKAVVRASSTLQEELEARVRELDLRERELEIVLKAVEAQREQLESVQAEYASRLEALVARAREVECERDRLRGEQAHLVGETIELEESTRAAGSVSVPAGSADGRAPARWNRLGSSPLEAA